MSKRSIRHTDPGQLTAAPWPAPALPNIDIDDGHTLSDGEIYETLRFVIADIVHDALVNPQPARRRPRKDKS